MTMSTGSRTTLTQGLAEGGTSDWVSCALFCGRSGYATIRAYGTFGGTAITLQTASDAAGTGAASLTGFSATAALSSVVHVSYMDFIQVVSTGGTDTSITVVASPHDRL